MRSLIGALYREWGISVAKEAQNPLLDLRDFCGCWISHRIRETEQNPYLRRIGCLEMSDFQSVSFVPSLPPAAENQAQVEHMFFTTFKISCIIIFINSYFELHMYFYVIKRYKSYSAIRGNNTTFNTLSGSAARTYGDLR